MAEGGGGGVVGGLGVGGRRREFVGGCHGELVGSLTCVYSILCFWKLLCLSLHTLLTTGRLRSFELREFHVHVELDLFKSLCFVEFGCL